MAPVSEPQGRHTVLCTRRVPLSTVCVGESFVYIVYTSIVYAYSYLKFNMNLNTVFTVYKMLNAKDPAVRSRVPYILGSY